jgi:hypothetical protein
VKSHLSVLEVRLQNTLYGQSDTSDSLDIARAQYSGANWDSRADLYHYLSGKSGGGIAYVGVVCNTYYGFGNSFGIIGDYAGGVVWDLVVFTHEVGHNFNSDHTHDTEGYTPIIDNCGNEYYTCPNINLPNSASTTIMSYCNLCPGGSEFLEQVVHMCLFFYCISNP